MSRSGYSDDCWGWELIMWRGRVASAIRGKRGQRLLVDLVRALDAMPEKRLIAGKLEFEGEVCALGAVGKARSIPMDNLDPENSGQIADVFDIAECLAQEITFINDVEAGWNETPEQRWRSVRAWAMSKILPVEIETA